MRGIGGECSTVLQCASQHVPCSTGSRSPLLTLDATKIVELFECSQMLRAVGAHFTLAVSRPASVRFASALDAGDQRGNVNDYLDWLRLGFTVPFADTLAALPHNPAIRAHRFPHVVALHLVEIFAAVAVAVGRFAAVNDLLRCGLAGCGFAVAGGVEVGEDSSGGFREGDRGRGGDKSHCASAGAAVSAVTFDSAHAATPSRVAS